MPILLFFTKVQCRAMSLYYGTMIESCLFCEKDNLNSKKKYSEDKVIKEPRTDFTHKANSENKSNFMAYNIHF